MKGICHSGLWLPFCWVLLCGLVPSPVSANSVDVTDEPGLRAAWADTAISDIRLSASLSLTDSLPVRITGDLVVTGSPGVVIDGGGHACFHARNINLEVATLSVHNCDGQMRMEEGERSGGAVRFVVNEAEAPAGRRLRLHDVELDGHSASAGGAVWIAGGDAELERVRIVNSHAPTRGGGIGLESGRLRLIDSVVENNRSTLGGGIAVEQGGVLEIAATRIIGNNATFGGGVAARDAEQVRIERSLMAGNGANFDGGGLWLVDSYLQLTQSSVTRNRGASLGGGVSLGPGAAARLVNVTVSSNSAGSLSGGGILVRDAEGLEMVFTTVFANTAGADGTQLLIIGPAAIAVTGSVVSAAPGSEDAAAIRMGSGTLTASYSLLGSRSGTGALVADEVSAQLNGSRAGLAPLRALTPWVEAHLPLAGSPLIGRVPAGQTGCQTSLQSDQSGRPRAHSDGCTIGSLEPEPAPLPVPLGGHLGLLWLALLLAGVAGLRLSGKQPFPTGHHVGPSSGWRRFLNRP